jgi:hypothetical protein
LVTPTTPVMRSHAQARHRAAGNCIRRGDERVCAVVDIEHGALRAFEEHGFTVVERVVEQNGRVSDQVANVRGGFHRLFKEPFGFKLMAIGRGADRVLFGNHALQFFAEALGIKQVANANAAAGHFVFVRRADAARGGADLRFAARQFGGAVHFAVIGENHVRAIAEEKPPANVDRTLLQIFQFAQQRGEIDHRAGTDHGLLAGAQNSAGNQLQHVLLIVEDDRVAGVVSACVARRVIKRRR